LNSVHLVTSWNEFSGLKERNIFIDYLAFCSCGDGILFFCFLDTGSPYVTQAGQELAV
jgi:hypothetical protein